MDIRSEVALLTRNIRIESGAHLHQTNSPFCVFSHDVSCACERASCVVVANSGVYRSTAPNSVNPSYGAHTIFRRGFTSVQVEGVEFADLGQGGFIMRYPIHFHMVIDAAPNTFVRDCSINRSWNRWYCTSNLISLRP